MAAKIPPKTRNEIRKRIYDAADNAHYLQSSRTDNADLIEKLCADPSIGGVIAQFVPKEKIRTYIKDGVLNRYTKEKKATKRPAQEDQIKFCSDHYQVTNFSVLEKGRDELILKSPTAPIYVVLVEGTYLKWESALRKGLLYGAGHPLGKNKANTVHIVLSLYVGGEAITPADKKLLQNALERAGADAYLWGS